jgi:hypothetical protein
MTAKMRSWFAPTQPGPKSRAERFAIPHTFPPDLSFPEVLIRLFAAMARVLLGSLLFALWGIMSARAWSTIPTHFWRLAAILPLVLLFLLPLTGLMAGISALVKVASQKLH